MNENATKTCVVTTKLCAQGSRWLRMAQLNSKGLRDAGLLPLNTREAPVSKERRPEGGKDQEMDSPLAPPQGRHQPFTGLALRRMWGS